MATSALQPQTPCMDRLDAAHALLGVSPAQAEGEGDSVRTGAGSLVEAGPQSSSSEPPSAVGGHQQQQGIGGDITNSAAATGWDPSLLSLSGNASRTGGNALDALAALATSASAAIGSGACSDEEAMPPPPPRRGGRLRSASNPEGMEKWDSIGRGRAASSRRHFVLPSSILEEELRDANLACEAAADNDCNARGQSLKKRLKEEEEEHQHGFFSPDQFGTSPNSVLPMAVDEHKGEGSMVTEDREDGTDEEEEEEQESAMEEDEANLEPAELLRRARARLLEDLSTEGTMGEKGVLPLPHSLSKYKEVYNKNGRIGIYTPAERAAIIAKFQSKRTRRVWNKKIRYNCRKNLADRRMRVKGRFVKRSTEVAAKFLKDPPKVERSASPTKAVAFADPAGSDGGALAEKPIGSSADTSATSSRASSPDLAATSGADAADSDMPDVNDEEAGFVPTKDQPFRRTRRHTIT